MEQENTKTLILIFGATGKSGFHIANRFLETGKHAVRIVVRSKTKVQKYFKESEKEFESIIEGNFYDENILKEAFKPSPNHGIVKIVVSGIGSEAAKNQAQVAKIESEGQCKVIDACINHKVQKYLIITAALIQRPWHPITVILNTIVPNVYTHKVITENYLRRSKQNYIIVRPPQLTGEFDDNEIMGYNLDQGDRIIGQISRRTLSEVVFHALESEKIPKQVTLECQRNTAKKQCEREDFTILKADDYQSILHVDHKRPKYVYWSVLLLGLLAMGYLTYSKFISTDVESD